MELLRYMKDKEEYIGERKYHRLNREEQDEESSEFH